MRQIWHIFLFFWLAVPALAQDRMSHIGVLAFRGAETTLQEWGPLAEYLTRTVEGWRFEIEPVTLVSAPDEIKSGHLDFLVTNPGHYVALAAEFGLSPLATRERSDGLMRFGTAVITRADSGILTLDDLRGRRVAAVSPDAFGGFQLAWHAFMAQGVDPFTDFKPLRFMGFPHDEIIRAVQRGEVDAGVIRGGLLEMLAAEGRFDLDEFVVLQSNSQMDFPYMVSGQLVPEWPFTAVPGVEKSLRESVTIALLVTQSLQSTGLADKWSAPLSYEGVRALSAAYHARDSENSIWIYIFAALATLIAALGIFRWRKPQMVEIMPEEPVEPDPEAVKTIALFERLTKREREVLALICDGLASKDIAEKLGVSLKTIEYHRSNLLQKTRAGTTAHLVQLATRFGYDLGNTLGK